jgi:K+-transporting ATPase KdpF subunit
MPAFATGCEAAMSDPIIALAVAVALAAYLIYALIKPEKF